MKGRLALLVVLGAIMLIVTAHGLSPVNAQSSTTEKDSSGNNIDSANSALEIETIDPFTLKGPSNLDSDNTNDQLIQTDESSTNNNNDDSSSSNNDNNNDDSSSSSSSSSNNNNDDNDNNDKSDKDKSSDNDKKSDSKDDKKFELPFP